ncbi:MAG: DUF4307 domain-containing protein [Agromyces sp.]
MSSLDARYGMRQPIRRGWWIAGIASTLAIVLGWMVWVNFGSVAIETQDVTHQYDAATQEMSITWNVSAKPGTRLSCALQALNEEFQVVGWKVVDLPPSTDYTRQFTERIRTVMVPNTGLAYSCWAS